MDIEAYLKRDYISNLINDGKRLDDRLFDEYRKISIEKDYSGAKASGSSMIHLGDTKVLVGISLDVGEPYPDSPESGVMTTSAELRPLAFHKRVRAGYLRLARQEPQRIKVIRVDHNKKHTQNKIREYIDICLSRR